MQKLGWFGAVRGAVKVMGNVKIAQGHDSPGTVVFWCQRSPRNSTGVTPYGGAKCRWGGSKSTTFDK